MQSIIPIHDLCRLPSPILFVGAAYSGKSELALSACDYETNAVVIGTADGQAGEFSRRIAALKDLRPKSWHHYEGQEEDLLADIRKGLSEYAQVIVDSLNQYIAWALVSRLHQYSLEQLHDQLEFELDEICKLLQSVSRRDQRIVFVGAEIGAGVVPAKTIERLFRELNGKFNRRIAACCASVVLVTAGIPQIVKGRS